MPRAPLVVAGLLACLAAVATAADTSPPAMDPASWGFCTGETKPGSGRHDCACGCALTGSLVCGANGLTYDSECLAICSGTTVAHRGACVVWIRGGAPPPDPHAARGGTPASAPPLETVVEGLGPRPTRQYHALAGMLDTSAASSPSFAAPRVEAAAADGAPPAGARTVSLDAIKAYAGDGFALVGAGRGPGAPAPAGAAKDGSAPKETVGEGGAAGVAVPVGPDHLRSVRYIVKSGLLYASVEPLAVDNGSVEDAASPRLVQDGYESPALKEASGAGGSAPTTPGDDDTSAPPHLISGPGTPPSAPGPARTGFNPSQWRQTTATPPKLPVRSATLLTKRRARADVVGSADDEPAPAPDALADTSSCSGVLIGRYVVGTAARCLYDRSTRKFAAPLVARPGAFRAPGGAFNAPMGIFDAVMYSVMAGYGEQGNSSFFPDAFDIGAVITDGGASRVIGDLVGGWMGFISDMAAFGRGSGSGAEPEQAARAAAGLAESPAPSAAAPMRQQPAQGAASMLLWAFGYPAITQALGSLWQWGGACSPPGGWGSLGRTANGTILELPNTACPGGEGGMSGAPLFDTQNYIRGFFTGFGGIPGGGGLGGGGGAGGMVDSFIAVTPTLFEFMRKSMALTPPPPAASNP